MSLTADHDLARLQPWLRDLLGAAGLLRCEDGAPLLAVLPSSARTELVAVGAITEQSLGCRLTERGQGLSEMCRQSETVSREFRERLVAAGRLADRWTRDCRAAGGDAPHERRRRARTAP